MDDTTIEIDQEKFSNKTFKRGKLVRTSVKESVILLCHHDEVYWYQSINKG